MYFMICYAWLWGAMGVLKFMVPYKADFCDIQVHQANKYTFKLLPYRAGRLEQF